MKMEKVSITQDNVKLCIKRMKVTLTEIFQRYLKNVFISRVFHLVIGQVSP